jgi:hypothetical protein
MRALQAVQRGLAGTQRHVIWPQVYEPTSEGKSLIMQAKRGQLFRFTGAFQPFWKPAQHQVFSFPPLYRGENWKAGVPD